MKTSEGPHEPAKSLLGLPMPDVAAINLALEFAKRGLDDAASSKSNYDAGRYSKAAEDLQQAVEKGAKAFGMLVGTMRATETDVKRVSHNSYLAFILDFETFFPKMLGAINGLFSQVPVETTGNFIVRRLVSSFAQAVKLLRKVTPTQEKVEAELKELRELDEEIMWNASMQLDLGNKWIKEAMNGMDQRPIINDRLQNVVSLAAASFQAFGRFSEGDVRQMKFALSLGKTGQKLFSLSLLTAWHHQTAGYPPVGKDYWKADAYRKGVPFVREMPRFTKYAKDAAESAVETCKAA